MAARVAISPSFAPDESDPIYLAVNESPAVILVTPLLTGRNYHSWSRSFQIALRSKNKLGFIDGSIPAPSLDDPKYSCWDRCNTMVISWISRAVEPSISQSLLWYDSAVAIWKNLKDRFGRGESMMIVTLQEQIYNLRQGVLNINDYYTSFQILWDQLMQLRPTPRCKCLATVNGGVCGDKCEVVIAMRTYIEGDQVMRFLRGLNDSYNSMRSQILMLDPLPSMNRVLSLAGEHQMQLLTPVMSITSVGNQFPVMAAQGFQSSKKPQCTFCGGVGYTIDKCFKKHGYPPGWITGYKSRPFGPPGVRSNGSVNQIFAATPGNCSSYQSIASPCYPAAATSYQPIAGPCYPASTSMYGQSMPMKPMITSAQPVSLTEELSKMNLTHEQFSNVLNLVQQTSPGTGILSSSVPNNSFGNGFLPTPLSSPTQPSSFHMTGPVPQDGDWHG